MSCCVGLVVYTTVWSSMLHESAVAVAVDVQETLELCDFHFSGFKVLCYSCSDLVAVVLILRCCHSEVALVRDLSREWTCIVADRSRVVLLNRW